MCGTAGIVCCLTQQTLLAVSHSVCCAGKQTVPVAGRRHFCWATQQTLSAVSQTGIACCVTQQTFPALSPSRRRLSCHTADIVCHDTQASNKTVALSHKLLDCLLLFAEVSSRVQGSWDVAIYIYIYVYVYMYGRPKEQMPLEKLPLPKSSRGTWSVAAKTCTSSFACRPSALHSEIDCVRSQAW